MSTTKVLGYSELAKAQGMAAQFSTDHKVMIIGPTDRVVLEKEGQDGTTWTSGATAEFYLLIATKDKIVGPQPDRPEG